MQDSIDPAHRVERLMSATAPKCIMFPVELLDVGLEGDDVSVLARVLAVPAEHRDCYASSAIALDAGLAHARVLSSLARLEAIGVVATESVSPSDPWITVSVSSAALWARIGADIS